ncbi:hypothetical protein SLE2022_367220 [Rubroshorea leprosula]
MNAVPVQENTAGSDSDSNPDDAPEYYQRISAVEDVEHEDRSDPDEQANSDEEHHNDSYRNRYRHQVENGISSLHLSEDVAEEEEERMRMASDLAIQRAFREDESRRNASLTPENAARVREAMRGVSFSGFAPHWANQVPEDQWIDQLRRLRRPQRTTNTVQN